MTGILTLLVSAGGLITAGDTIMEVRQGDRLLLRDFSGSVYVESWDRPQMSLEAETEGSIRFRVNRTGAALELRVEDNKARNRAEELRVVLPPWMSLELSGRALEAEVRGMTGEVRIQNLEGDITLRDLTGRVEASTSEGEIRAWNLSGAARLRTGDDDLWIGDSSGALDVETVDGEIEMEGIRSSRILTRTTEGEITFSGRLEDGGDFEFHSHGGGIELNLLPPVNLDVTVLAYDGDFQSEFPVFARGYRSGEGLEFRLGEGGGRLVLEAFDGDITINNAVGEPGSGREVPPAANRSE
jgi:hypothetical protein